VTKVLARDFAAFRELEPRAGKRLRMIFVVNSIAFAGFEPEGKNHEGGPGRDKRIEGFRP
jgi:hypothetical protein